VKASISTALALHYAGDALTLARLWKVTRRDATVYAFTDHDQAITFGGLTYQPSSAFDASALSTKAELNVDNLEVVGLLDSTGITVADIEAGLWDGAAIELREVNWADLSMGANILRTGETGQVSRKRGQYVAELRGLMQKLQNNVGRIVTPACDAVLGDARCGVNLTPLRVSGTVTAVTDRRTFAASALAQAAAYFSYGVLVWVTGANAGRSMEVKQHAAGGALTLQLTMGNAIMIGDTFTITPGCDRTKAVCVSKFTNVVNFRGFSYVPGQTAVLSVGGQ
jgi:uncharacterized phage protein (TIGR02218 family)